MSGWFSERCQSGELEEDKSKLEDVDLSDQHGLIAMAEANNKVADSTPPVSPEKSESSKKKDVPKTVTCTKTTAFLLFLIAIAAAVLSSFVTYWITKSYYDHTMVIRPFMDENNKILNVTSDDEVIQEVSDGPTAAELRLPKDLVPIWYNITLKTYLPGYIEFPEDKNLTFDAALIIKFRVKEPTDQIVLSARKLQFPDIDEIKVLQDRQSKPVSRARRETTNLENITLEVETTTSLQAVIEEKVDELPKSGPEKPNTTKNQPKSNRIAADVQVKKVIVNDTVHMVKMILDGDLEKGKEYYLQLPYSGPIDRYRLAGLYLSHYQDENGRTRYAAVTQMEPTDARRMVPCFDEPEFKAIWKVKVIHPAGTSAISNGMEIKNGEQTDNPDWVVTSFVESPPMSPYLLALTVTDFDYNEGTTNRGTRFRIWSRKEAINQTTFALYAGITALEFFEDFYGIPFPLRKQDMIALPDFAAGAMENWGLVTYRERLLLYDEKLYEPQQKLSVALVVAHELSHQWFGNLVTMKWWNDLWLNEGFATFMEYLGAEAVGKGNIRMSDYFLEDAMELAYERDAQATSHPLLFPIEKAEDVSGAFDDVTYQKGASVIYMIQQVMGPENFRKGLTGYLEQHRYGNADHDDLWSALNEAIPDTLLAWDGDKLDIRDFASKWTQQMGYPVVEVRRIDPQKVELHQKRFKWNENALEREKFRNARYWYKYDIPIFYAINGEEKPMTWLHESLDLETGPDDLLIINTDSRGFYRVNYNDELWQKIIEQLMDDHNKISVRSRARIVGDAFALAEANIIPYEVPLNLTKYLVNEEEYLPWIMALSGFATILDNFDYDPETQYVRDYLEPLIAPLYNQIDWKAFETAYLDDKLFFENELQYAIIRQYCKIRNVNCTDKLYELFHARFLEPCRNKALQSSECSSVPLPIRRLAYCEGVRIGNEKIWNEVYVLYKRERVQVERDRLQRALSCSRDPLTLRKLLGLAADLNDTSIRLQDAPTTFASVAIEDVGGLIIFDYFLDNWPHLYKDIKEQQTLLRYIIQSSTSLNTERQIQQLEAFIKKYRKDTSRLDVFGQQLEKSKNDKLWRDRNFEHLSKWFKYQNKNRSQQSR